MKLNKLMFAALAIGALTLASCEKKKDPIVIPPTPTEDVPEVEKPAEGYVTIVINIPEGTECNGIYLKGNLGGDDWSGENTYVGLEAANVPADQAVRFEAIENSKKWFKATFKLGEGGLQGKICLKYEGDGSWQGQAINVTLDETNTTVALESISGEGQFVIAAGAPAGVLYLNIGGWNKSECATVVLTERHVVLIVPTNDCGFEIPSIVGSFNDWNATEIAMTAVEEGVKYEARVQAEDNDQFKIAGSVSGWDNELLVIDNNPESENYDTFVGNPNITFGDQTEFELNYADGKWKACSEAAE